MSKVLKDFQLKKYFWWARRTVVIKQHFNHGALSPPYIDG